MFLLKRAPLVLSCVLSCLVVAGETAIIPHLPQNDMFSTAIAAENLLGRERKITLELRGANGRFLGSFQRDLKANSRIEIQPNELAENVIPDYILIFAADGGSLNGLRTGVEFQFRDNPDSRTFVPAIENPASTWRIYAGNWAEVFDGVAIVYGGDCTRAAINIQHFSRNGERLSQLTLAEDGGQQNKFLINLPSSFRADAGSYFEISSRAPLAITALRGANSGGSKASYLVGNTAVPMPEKTAERDALEAARNQWRATGLASAYILRYENRCFCLPDLTRPVDLMVKSNYIQSFQYVNSNDPVADHLFEFFYTVDGLFDQIEDAINRGAHSIEVSYHERFGYPVEAFIDYDLCSADEERGFAVLNFESIRQ